MEQNSSTSKWKRQLVPSARSKAQATNTFDRRGNNHLAEARAEDARRHEFSLDSLDKEILQTMSRGTSTKSTAPDSASCESSSGSTQEKAMCSPHPVPAAYVRTHSSESSTNTKKPIIGQFQAPPLPVWPSGWPEGDARFNGYKQQVAVNVNGSPALKQEPTPNHWSHHHHHPHRPAAGRAGGTHTVTFDLKPDSPFRDLHSLTSRLDAACGEDHKQASHEGGGGGGGGGGPYPASVGMFAYPGTPQRLLNPGGQRTEDQASNVVGVGSPGYHERPGDQRSGTKSKTPKVPPSKWDDAGKWIASPVHNDSGSVTSENARSPTQGLVSPSPFVLPVAGKVEIEARTESDIPNLMDTTATTSSVNEPTTPTETTPGSPLCKTSTPTSTDPINTTPSSVRVKDQIKQIESAIQCSMAKLASPSTNAEPVVKRSVRAVSAGVKSSAGKDASVITSTMFVQRPKDNHLDAMISPPSLLVDLKAHQQAQNGNPFAQLPAEPKPPLVAVLTTPPPPPEAPVKVISNGANSRDSLITDLDTSLADIFSNGSISVRESATDTADQSYRDMGTQMTPNPSVRLPRGATFALSPTHHNTPDHSRSATTLTSPDVKKDLQSCEQQGERRSQAVPHPTLDRFMFSWSTREEEEAESAAPCLRGESGGAHREAHAVVSPYVAWASAWEEAERAKYTARFRQEEAKIQAWEDHQKAKAEAQMRRTETKLEKMHENASQKMVNKIAIAHKKAEDMRAVAEACRDELASKAKRRAEYIRQTGNAPSTLGCFASRLVPFQSNLQ